MSVRVVARIRPLLKTELDKDVIVESASIDSGALVRIPNPRKESESYSFQFNSVYDETASQQQIFDAEVAPTIKSVFKGIDVTVFAYGVTGTGKTFSMRGGKSLADRGIIPRLLSGIYRRARKLEKDTAGETTVNVTMTYYEIYCDRVYDLFEPPEKRSAAGLPIRDTGRSTVVVGLTEKPCTTLKDFESMYDEANVNRSTGATKLNAHSSRSHAVLSVKITQTSSDCVQTSTVSAIDLAGSEDNRRTDNGKERMVESAAINKSLFVLAQCVEAISKKDARVPYRESKMTRILSLGQNKGITIMILNIAPVKSYHLDTLSSLNFANRTKKIEVVEVENQPVARGKTDAGSSLSSFGPTMQRQPLKPKNFSTNIIPRELTANGDKLQKLEKPVKSFMVYTEKSKASRMEPLKAPLKRLSGESHSNARPTKMPRAEVVGRTIAPGLTNLTADAIEALIDKKVSERLASAAMNASIPTSSAQSLSSDVQARLNALEQRVHSQENERSEGLQYLLMAKQHQVRGETSSALRMYQLAVPFFPANEKLKRKIAFCQQQMLSQDPGMECQAQRISKPIRSRHDEDASFHDDDDAGAPDEEDDSFLPARRQVKPKRKLHVRPDHSAASDGSEDELAPDTPRTRELVRIINSRDVGQIRLLKGVGAKKAEAIVNCLCELEDVEGALGYTDLGRLKGIGMKGLEKMREGLVGAC